ncbi:LysR family transcriptional regulator [Pseudooceanicola marinus]|uniref:LysR family transcriptional regulator n=1 Tax=Pseudooceanicola marinus TaxID=396013 RepID=UPI001CD5F498|nr:LysR family transcriptional regulator [Pseudooceanicola marinus]MCA1336363.1 LysR family transcriptional regulator [Pseudooceanicola marinus]
MSDRLAAMSLLVAAVDAGSLSAAARRAGMPLATVSRRVAELEQELGTQIVLRSPRGLSLTEPGETYLAACRSILEQISEAERMVAGEFREPKGLLNVTAPICFGRIHVLNVVTEFLRDHPAVDVRLEQTDRPINLGEEHIDAAVRIGNLTDSALRARRLGEVRKVVVASPDYLEARGVPETPEDLAGHDCLSFESIMRSDRWTFTDGEAERHVRVRSRLSMNAADTAILAAEAGLGITRVLSYQVAPLVKAGTLRILLEDFEPPRWPVHLLYRGGVVPQKLRAFVDYAAPRLRDSMADTW